MKKLAVLALVGASMLVCPFQGVYAEETIIEEIVVTGIRNSLRQSLDVKRDATQVVDAVSAEDVGKFPDANVAEALQRITGVAIDRSGGEGQFITVRGLGPEFQHRIVEQSDDCDRQCGPRVFVRRACVRHHPARRGVQDV